jgi:hypothetical protein
MNKLIAIICIIFFFRIDNCLSQIAFEKEYNTPGVFVIQNSLVLSDGFLLIGNYNNGGFHPQGSVIKTNQNGSPVKSVCKGNNTFYDGCITADNNYVFAGGTNADPLLTYTAEYITKVDSSFNTIWSYERNNSSGYIVKVAPTFDSGVVCAGTINDNGFDKTHIIKFDASGNKQWACLLGDSISQYPYDIKQTSDSGFVIVGYASFQQVDMFMTKINAAGIPEWTEIYSGLSGMYDAAVSVLQNADSGFTIFGDVDLFQKILFRTDLYGNILWAYQFPGTGTPSASHGCLQFASNGNYLVNGIVGGASIAEFDHGGNLIITTSFEGNKRYDLNPFQQFNDDYLFTAYDNGLTYLLRTNKANSCLSVSASPTPSFSHLNTSSRLSWTLANDVYIPRSDTSILLSFTEDTLCFIHTTGIPETQEVQLNISPNPASQTINITFFNSTLRNVSIINQFNQIILSLTTTDYELKFDVSKFSSGIYYCRIESASENFTKVFIKN